MGRSTDSALERVFQLIKNPALNPEPETYAMPNTRSYIASNLLPIFRRCKHSKRALTAIVGMGRSPGSGSSSLAAFPELPFQWPYRRRLPLQWRDRFGFPNSLFVANDTHLQPYSVVTLILAVSLNFVNKYLSSHSKSLGSKVNIFLSNRDHKITKFHSVFSSFLSVRSVRLSCPLKVSIPSATIPSPQRPQEIFPGWYR